MDGGALTALLIIAFGMGAGTGFAAAAAIAVRYVMLKSVKKGPARETREEGPVAAGRAG